MYDIFVLIIHKHITIEKETRPPIDEGFKLGRG